MSDIFCFPNNFYVFVVVIDHLLLNGTLTLLQEKRPELAYPKWLSGEGTYQLWLVFNVLLSQLNPLLSASSLNDLLQVMFKYVGYSWDSSSAYLDKEQLSFPEFLEVLTGKINDSFGLVNEKCLIAFCRDCQPVQRKEEMLVSKTPGWL